MKKNAVSLTLLSLVIGALVTLGFSRSHPNGTMDPCTYVAPGGAQSTLTNQVPQVKLCASEQLGYPYKYLHSQTFVPQGSNGVFLTTRPWVEFKPAVADWLIWSLVSAGGIGLLVYLLERAGISTGFADKKRRR